MIDKTVRDLLGLMQRANAKKTDSYDTPAEVTRVEDGVAWVHIPGGVDETPVKLTVNAQAGDTVQLRVGNGTAWIVGNATAPPTDDTVAEYAVEQNIQTNKVVSIVQNVVNVVSKIAGDTAQHFWVTEEGTDTGAHITEIPQEDFLADPEHGGGNLLARSNGIAVRDGLTELATFSQDGLDVNVSDSNDNLVNIAHLGYGLGNAQSGQAYAPYYTLGVRGTGSIGNYSTAEGQYTVASGAFSHAEGVRTSAEGYATHAEGVNTRCYMSASHAEGSGSYANGFNSHAEGYETLASGFHSHSQNLGTKATQKSQTAIGEYNLPDTGGQGDTRGDYVFIVGNGTADDARSNALAIDWDGDVLSGLTSLNLGICITSAILTSSGGTLQFTIPTGRTFPNGTTITKITFNIIARVNGSYIIKGTSGGTDSASFDSSLASSFYNSANASKSLTTSMWSKTIQGGTNIYISLTGGASDFFGGSALNNSAVCLYLSNIQVTLSNPFRT